MSKILFPCLEINVYNITTDFSYANCFNNDNWSVEKVFDELKNIKFTVDHIHKQEIIISVFGGAIDLKLVKIENKDNNNIIKLLKTKIHLLENKIKMLESENLKECLVLNIDLTDIDKVCKEIGYVLDISGKGNHMKLSINGHIDSINKRIDFTDNSSNGIIKYSSSLLLKDSYTVEAIIETIKYPDQSGGGFILAYVGLYYLELSKSGKIRVYCYGGCNDYMEGNKILDINKKYKISYTYDRLFHKIYIDDELDKIIKFEGTITPNGNYDIYVGKYTNNTYPFYGYIYSLKVYNKNIYI